MNKSEIAFKLVIDVILFFIIYIIVSPEGFTGVFSIIIVSHTVNWVINGQPVALLYHMDIGEGNPEKFIDYVVKLERRISKKNFTGCAAYGSLSTGNYNTRSDIDIRIVVGDSFFERLDAVFFCFKERARAFIFWFPLDLYLFTLDEVKKKMSPKEPPTIFLDRSGLLHREYKSVIEFDVFADQFTRRYCEI